MVTQYRVLEEALEGITEWLLIAD